MKAPGGALGIGCISHKDHRYACTLFIAYEEHFQHQVSKLTHLATQLLRENWVECRSRTLDIARRFGVKLKNLHQPQEACSQRWGTQLRSVAHVSENYNLLHHLALNPPAKRPAAWVILCRLLADPLNHLDVTALGELYRMKVVPALAWVEKVDCTLALPRRVVIDPGGPDIARYVRISS